MRSIHKIVVAVMVAILTISTGKVSSLNAIEGIPFSGDVVGGVNISYTNATADTISWYFINPTIKNWGNAKGIAFRMKNNIPDGGGSPLHFAINETDSDRIMPFYNNGVNKIQFVNLDGTFTENALRDFDNAVILPGGFDGYVYLPFSSFHFDSTNFGNSTMDIANIWGIYIGTNTKYDSFSNYDFGDIEIVNADDTTTKILDLSEVTELNLGSHLMKDYMGEFVNFTRLPGAKSDEIDFDYSTVQLQGDLSFGANISYQPSEVDHLAITKLTPTTLDWSNGIALSLRIKNNTSLTTPIEITVHETSGEIFITDKSLDTIYFVTLDGTMTSNAYRDWDSRMCIPSGFDGYAIIPLKSFLLLNTAVNDGLLDLANIYAMFLGVSNFKNYDAFANYKVGDIELIKQDSVSLLTDFATLDEAAFQMAVSPDVNGTEIIVSRLGDEVVIVPTPATRFGDVKVLEDFEYETTEEIQTEYPLWSGGSTVINSLYPDGGMLVEIGGTVPGNNIYASLDIFPKSKVSDWTVWNDGGENKDQAAQGITFYVKNLSPKEITINLEFEEKTDTAFERWNIKYGAMIMLQDKNGSEFIVHAKPVFAIPVGFEGWVRIDFSQYWVPEWCTTGDLVLDLTQPITGFFLTTDTTKNEGLSYVIDDIGIYYNKTAVSSLFYTPSNSFNTNMGIE